MKQLIFPTLAFIFFLFFTALPVISADENTVSPNGIIMQDANMRTGPGTNSPIITALLQGTEVIKIQHQGEWLQVNALIYGKTGWVHSSLVEEVSTTAQVFPKIIVGIIDIQRVLDESMQGQAAKKRIELMQSDNEDQYVSLTIEEQVVSGIIIEIQAVVDAYVRRNGYTHILNKNSGAVFYHAGMFDITDDIIKAYDLQVVQSNERP